jgi:hypothetical protein
MRLHEINQPIDEAINFTRYLNDAENAMKNGILTACSVLTKVKITPEMQADIDETRKLGSVRQVLNLPELIKQHCTDELKQLTEVIIPQPPVDVVFEPLGTVNGECADLEVRLNIKYINGIANQLWIKWVNELAKNNTSNPFNYAKAAKKSIEEFKNQLFEGPIGGIVDNCASTFIHEMVHAQQHATQYGKGRTDLEYRSYLASKDKFNKVIDDPESSGIDDTEAYKLYRASPQEMAAFANQDALKFIKDNKLNVQGATADAATMAKLQNYLGNYFRDRANPKEYKLLKRYGSLVYKAVADYLNRNAAQAKQNTQ